MKKITSFVLMLFFLCDIFADNVKNEGESHSMRGLYSLHVMPLLDGKEEALARDAEMLLKERICTKIACMMTLVPEGDPVVDKAEILRERYQKFIKAFQGDHSAVGILIQASIGHGWTPDSQAPFQKIIRDDGVEVYKMCPLDPRFLAYLSDQISKLAALKPNFFMIDDDFRMLTYNTGCFCPLHLKAFAKKAGRSYSRTELVDAVKNDREIAVLYDEVLQEGLLNAATVIRAAIDSRAPGTPCGFCTCVGDVRHGSRIAKVLAGENGPKIIRINNARYMKADMRTFPRRMYEGAAQIAALDADSLILAETDTCPHNRWSTSATLLHAHYTGSILEGCQGAKHWITKLEKFSPECGRAYREILSKYALFYEKLAELRRDATPDFFIAAPFPEKLPFNNPITENALIGVKENWGDYLGMMGFPCDFAKSPNTLPVMLTGEEVRQFSNDELQKFAASGMVLDGGAAIEFTKRGLTPLTGVVAEEWTGKRISGEQEGERWICGAANYAKLTPVDAEKSQVMSWLVHRNSGLEKGELLSPALILTEHPQGGRCAVFAASIPQVHFAKFTWLDIDRKKQLVKVLNYITNRQFPCVAGDSEIYLKTYRLKDDSLLLAFFNLSFDPLQKIPLEFPLAGQAEQLLPDGSWRSVKLQGNQILLPLLPGTPEIIRFKGQ